MDLNRREFLKLSGSVLPATALASLGTNILLAAATPAEAAVPWHQRLRRVGQLNFNERDPVELDVERWADYWAGAKVDAVLISVTGIIAFYPTEVPFHRRSQFLGKRDLFGECVAAARKRGLRVIGRTSPDLNWQEALGPHPEWFMRNGGESFQVHGEDHRLYRTCMFSGYFTDYMPAIFREVNSRYDVDGLYTNGWPPLGELPVCHCAACAKLAPPGTVDYWEQFNDRTEHLWNLYSAIAREKGPDNIFFANLGGGLRAGPNLSRIGRYCQWFNCDNQGRGGEGLPIWGAAQQGRVATAAMKGGTITNVTGAWSTCGQVRWRNASKSPAEAEIWLGQTLASGMTIYYHWLGGQKGLGEDRRWQATGRRYLQWHARHERHFENRRSMANIAVVMGQRTHLFHTPAGEGKMQEFIDGLYYALLEGRHLFDFVHEEDLGPDTLGRYQVVLLPNVAWLSDRQCQQLKDYAASGGSLMASFETGLYDERGRRRENPGLAELFGIDSIGPIAGPNGNGFYARIERAHELVQGFGDTNWIPGGAYRLPVQAAGTPILSVVPAYTAYPPELSYAPLDRTSEPAVVALESGTSRRLYFSGDLERASWRSGHTDLSQLLRNAVNWLTRGARPVAVTGDGVVECFAWETAPGFALHVLNYTNPNLHRGWLRRHYAIGEQKVTFSLPAGCLVSRVQLLRAERDIAFDQQGATVTFTIPNVQDYEVAALYA
jgi:hypothetical protein